MIIDDVVKADKARKAGKSNDDIYATGYYTGSGVIVGMLLGQYWDKLGLPGDDVKFTESLITHQKIENNKGFSAQKLIQMALSTGLMALELVGVKGAAASGAGMLLGFTFMSSSKKGEYIGEV